MNISTFRVYYHLDSTDSKGRPKTQYLGSKEIFDYQRMNKYAKAYLYAEGAQVKANRLEFREIQ